MIYFFIFEYIIEFDAAVHLYILLVLFQFYGWKTDSVKGVNSRVTS